MISFLEKIALGSSEDLVLEHRCYNGVCLIAAVGCLMATVINTLIDIPLAITMATLIIGVSYLWLYTRSRQSRTYTPNLWIYLTSGTVLLVMTWFFNGGINGSDILVSMAALVAMTVVLKSRHFLTIFTLFFPIMSLLFLAEYLYPELVSTYTNRGQRFLDIYFTFAVCTLVISIIIVLIIKSHNTEKSRLDRANLRLKDQMEVLNRTNAELEDALAQVRTLSGLLPICASCKRIRDDRGYWNQIEIYIKNHSQAEFSHGICPECSEKLYGDSDWYPTVKQKRKG